MINQQWLYQLERKYSRYAISNLMNYIVGGMGIVFLLNQLPGIFGVGSLTQYLYFSRNLVTGGQIWRLITFIFIPPASSPLFIFFSLYLYWMIGNALENHWGRFKFNLFYLCGVIGTLLAGFLTGYAMNDYLNMSLFFAFALLYPNLELNLFMILPVKIKYLAMLNAAFFVLTFIQTNWPGKAALLASIVNVFLFFGKDLFTTIKQWQRRREFKSAFKR